MLVPEKRGGGGNSPAYTRQQHTRTHERLEVLTSPHALNRRIIPALSADKHGFFRRKTKTRNTCTYTFSFVQTHKQADLCLKLARQTDRRGNPREKKRTPKRRDKNHKSSKTSSRAVALQALAVDGQQHVFWSDARHRCSALRVRHLRGSQHPMARKILSTTG